MADQAERLREMVRQMRRREKAKAAKVVTVLSGKGGVGKTSFVVNFAIALAKLEKRVVIIDADFGFSNVDLMLGVNSYYNLGHVMRGEKKLEEIVQDCSYGIRFISGGSGLDELVNMPEEAGNRLLEQLGQLDSEADVILFDMGAGMSQNTLKIMEASDETVLVVTPEPTSIMDAFVVVKMAAGLDSQPKISVLINKAATEKDAKTTYENFCAVIHKHLNYNLDVMGFICRDEQVTKAILALQPLLLKSPGSTAAKQIAAAAERFVESEEFEFRSGGLRGFIGRLSGRAR